MADKDYQHIDNPYDSFLERQTNEFGLLANPTASTSGNSGGGNSIASGGAVVENPSDIDESSVDGKSFSDVWIDNWIKSRSYQPKSRGFYLNARTGYAEFTDVYITGTITGATITGATITGSTITGGTIRTATSGKRVEILASNNSLTFYDAVGQVIGIGTESGTAMRIDLNATTTAGVRVNTSTASTTGFSYSNTGDVISRALNIELTGGTGNTSTAVNIDHDGNSGEALFIDVSNGAKGIMVTGSANANLVQILATRVGSQTALSILKNSSSGTDNLVELENSDGGIVLHITQSSTSSSNPAVFILSESTSASAAPLKIDRNGGEACIDIDQDDAAGGNCIGIKLNIGGGGAGKKYAFHFEGGEYMASITSVATVTGAVRVLTSDGEVFIPVYSTAS